MTEQAAAPKTTVELLELARARVAKLEQRLVTEQVLASISAGDNVEFRYGRTQAEKRDEAGNVTQEAREARILSGVVEGTRDVAGPRGSTVKQVRIRAGEGFEAEFYNVSATAITKIGEADTGSSEEDEADEATADEANEGDPLAAE